MKFHTSTSPPCLSYAPLMLSSSSFIASQHPTVFIPPQTTKIFAFQALLKRPSSTISHRNHRAPPFCHSKSCTLTSPRQTWAWVAHIHILCLWRWFALGEVNTSSKSLKTPLDCILLPLKSILKLPWHQMGQDLELCQSTIPQPDI